MKERTSRSWFPFWSEKWLHGSMRLEFSVEERAIWVDLLALANKDAGWIRANEDIGYPIEQLSGMLVIPKELLEKTLRKLVRKEKLKKYPKNIYYITNWPKYAFTNRHKRRLESEMSAKKDNTAAKKDTREEKRIEEKRKEEKKRKKKGPDPTQKITFSFEKKEFENITESDLQGWREAFPACRIEFELKRMREWLLANPTKRKSNYRRFIVNWLSKTQDSGGTKAAPAGIGGWSSRRKKNERS